MSSHHLKRLAMPRSWPLPRKTTVWVTRPTPGAHSLEHCMPLTLVVRDMLGLAKTAREVRHILHNELAKVDGRVVKDTRRGVGIMDVLTLGEENYRCVLDHNGRLRYRPISAKEAGWKVCRIEGKTTIKGGKTQLNLHDGRNLIVEDPKEYNTGDSLKLICPTKKSSSTFASQKALAAISSAVRTWAPLQKSLNTSRSVPACPMKFSSAHSVLLFAMSSLSVTPAFLSRRWLNERYCQPNEPIARGQSLREHRRR